MSLWRWLRWTRAHVFEWSGLNRRARLRLDGRRAVILMYHRVLPRALARDRTVEPGMFVTPEGFAEQLSWLSAEFRVLSLGEIVSRLATGASLPPRACALTFDDGWRDNFDHALPELEKRALPATVFVVTGRVGGPGAFWPDEVFRRLASIPSSEAEDLARSLGSGVGDPGERLVAMLKEQRPEQRKRSLETLRAHSRLPGEGLRELMNWDELDRLKQAGIDIESHGVSHALLPQLSPDQAELELRDSRRTLLERGHGAHGLLAYPSGAHCRWIRELAGRSGYRAAVTTARGLAGPSTSPYALPRLGVHQDIASTRAELLHKIPGSWGDGPLQDDGDSPGSSGRGGSADS